ncbi:Rne/Rng family ribonuclease, partial [bacterium]|nr:Rne/Rng family ribonuclease [bacterium]
MSSKILINASHHEEIRVAIVEQGKLTEYDHDRLDNVNRKGCIYKGYVSRIEPSLNAAFIDYGVNRHGFLPVSEVTSQLYPKHLDPAGKYVIADLLKEGQEVIVQVDKDERGNKGAALTTNISLAGCYIVLMPMTAHAGGISRQIEGDDRDHLVRLMNQMDIPDQYSIIVRTASIGRSLNELLWDFNVLKSQWEAIVQYAGNYAQPILLHKDGALLSRIIRDHLKPDVDEIIIDDMSVYQEVLKLVQHIRPDFLSLVKYFEKSSEQPLFAYYGIEHDIESIFNPQVIMDNGSTLVIDHREALTSIDINSARSTANADIETTAFKTNMAAAVEIARQIRLRNIGGQIVIDFIDMSSQEHCRQVEQAFKEALATRDKARIQLGKISKFGLLEMSRQRMKTSLNEVQLMQCEGCHGRGMHRRPRSVALSVLRLLEQESMNKKDSIFEIKVHPKIADMLSNAYRQDLCTIEKRCVVTIMINPQAEKSVGDYEIILKQLSGNNHIEVQVIRNFMPDNNTEQEQLVRVTNTPKSLNNQIKLSPPNPKGESIFKKIWNFLFGAPKIKAVVPVLKPAPRQPSSHRSHHKDRAATQKIEDKGQSTNPHQNKPQPQSQQNRRRPMKKPSGGPLLQAQEVMAPTAAPVQNQSTTQQGQRSGRRRYRRPSENDATKNKMDE